MSVFSINLSGFFCAGNIIPHCLHPELPVRIFVILFYQEPLFFFPGHPDEHEYTFEFFASEYHLHFPVPILPLFSSQVPLSQIETSPAPYMPSGIVPSKPAYARSWSSTITASLLSAGLRDGPFGIAQDLRTPCISSLRSKCRLFEWCSCTTNIGISSFYP